MFLHTHPYPPFIFNSTTKLIVGTLPPPRFTTGDLKADDVNCCYGSRDGQLWPILNTIFNLDLKYETTEEEIAQRKEFLFNRGIGICDIVALAKREKVDASDIGMQDVELRDVIGVLMKYSKIDTLLFTGGNSKNGPEYFFRKHLATYNTKLEVVSNDVPRVHQFVIPNSERLVKTVSLTAPSGAASRAVGSLQKYKEMKAKNPSMNTIDFRVDQYRPYF